MKVQVTAYASVPTWLVVVELLEERARLEEHSEDGIIDPHGLRVLATAVRMQAERGAQRAFAARHLGA